MDGTLKPVALSGLKGQDDGAPARSGGVTIGKQARQKAPWGRKEPFVAESLAPRDASPPQD
jgi:hypothetical protein